MITIIERYREFICGASAGCIETFVLFPKTKIIFRQQLHNVTLVDAAKQVFFNFNFLKIKIYFLVKARGCQKLVTSLFFEV